MQGLRFLILLPSMPPYPGILVSPPSCVWVVKVIIDIPIPQRQDVSLFLYTLAFSSYTLAHLCNWEIPQPTSLVTETPVTTPAVGCHPTTGSSAMALSVLSWHTGLDPRFVWSQLLVALKSGLFTPPCPLCLPQLFTGSLLWSPCSFLPWG